SPTTTDDDRKIVEYLYPLTKIDNLESYVKKLFEAKSTGETCNVDTMLERKDEFLHEMNEEKKRSNLAGILFSIVDILKQKNLTLIPGEHEEQVVRAAFKVDVNDCIADLGSRISRKKEIIPVLEAYFNSNS
ncbi:unnamed protein product, partial [Rotaria sp. Silwood1]